MTTITIQIIMTISSSSPIPTETPMIGPSSVSTPSIRYDTIEEFNVDLKAEYTA